MTDTAESAEPPTRARLTGPYSTYLTTVVRATRIGPRFVRVTLGGGDLARFESVGPDTFVYLLLPPPGRTELNVDASFTWDWHREQAEQDQPRGAYYTVRNHRADAAEIDIDMVLHGDHGASGWAERVSAGDPVALWGPRMLYAPLPTDGWLLLVADETGLPALAAILESLDDDARAVAVIEVGDHADEQPLSTRADVAVHWVHRERSLPGASDVLAERLRELILPSGPGYAWGGGESRNMTAVRHHLRDDRGFAADDVCVVAYWRRS